VRRGGRLLLVRRAGPGLLAGLWGPPAVAVAPGEAAGPALRAALRREHGVAAAVGGELARVERRLTHRALTLVALGCRLRGPTPRAGEGLRWAAPRELPGLGLASATRALLAQLD